MEPDQRNQPPADRGATGASQSLLDRKEVLGGEFSLRWVGWGAVFSPGVQLSVARATCGAARVGGTAAWPEEPAGLSQLLSTRPGVIAGGLVGLIFAVCLVGFMLYRMKKKDEGSYSLEEPKQANGGAYQKPSKQEEFYA